MFCACRGIKLSCLISKPKVAGSILTEVKQLNNSLTNDLPFQLLSRGVYVELEISSDNVQLQKYLQMSMSSKKIFTKLCFFSSVN